MVAERALELIAQRDWLAIREVLHPYIRWTRADGSLLRHGVLPEESVHEVVRSVQAHVREAGFEVLGTTRSPIKGAKGNVEVLAHLRPI